MKQDAKKFIKRYFAERGLTYASSGLDAYLFLVSEVGEIGDAIVHTRDQWVRNNPDRKRELKDELADAYMMLAITADLYNVDLDQALLDKMAEKGFDYRKQGKVYLRKEA
jgi:NTP pyrophosphatase (non-canonical NTP hydrolase)